MNWAEEIEINRDALIRIVAALVAMVGLGAVSRGIRLQVLRSLRPAETAVRRLIVIAARGLVLKPIVPRTMPAGLAQQLRSQRKERDIRPVFALSDIHVKMVPPVRSYLKKGRRITFVAPMDPTITALFEAQARAHAVRSIAPAPDKGAVARAALVRRLEAIKLALDDLPRQARRLVRWRARREAIAAKRPIHTSPIRSGRAPYLPREPSSDIEFVLERCHLLARDVLRADTS